MMYVVGMGKIGAHLVLRACTFLCAFAKAVSSSSFAARSHVLFGRITLFADPTGEFRLLAGEHV
jgi:hypothetical protein